MAADGIHHISAEVMEMLPLLTNVCNKLLLQCKFIGPMGPQTGGKAFVVGRGKSILGIVNQLAHGIVIQQRKPSPILQSKSDALHIPLGTKPVVPLQGTAADRTFEVGYWVFIRFGAAKQKCSFIPLGGMGKIGVSQIFPKDTVAVGLNGVHAPFLCSAGIIPYPRLKIC